MAEQSVTHWHYKQRSDGWWIIGPAGEPYVAGVNEDYPNAEANARLIAAAPEMYEVIKAIPGFAIRQVRNIAVRECLYCGARHDYGDEEQHHEGCHYVKARTILDKIQGSGS